MAKESIKEKMLDRYRDAVDEYYAFKNEFPESPRLKEATNMLNEAEKAIKRLWQANESTKQQDNKSK